MESYGMTNEKLYILPYVAPSYIEKEEGMLNDMRHYNLPPKFLFYPAQFWKHKNHDKLIRAIGNLLGRIPDLKIVFTGSPKNAYEDVKTLISNLSLSNQIILLGYVPDEDMTAIYRRARALIMPTYFGPTNIPPLEAFSLGCPVAVSRIYGMPEQVGDAALLFDPSSDTEIAEIIYRLWTDDELCNTLSRKGRERAAIWDKNAFEKQFAKIVSSITKK
jgi:glycosyltransferase involved in cell wall biosynthesis